MKIRKVLKVLCFLFLIILFGCNIDNRKHDEIRIAIFQISEYELIANMRHSFSEEILNSDLAKIKKIKILPYYDAHNDVNLTNQIADKIISQKPDLIYVLGTPAAQALAQRTDSIPIVQGAVTDPIAAKLAKAWEGSGTNYAASTDYPPIQAQFELLSKILPNVKRIGAIYNSGEDNSTALMKRVREVCPKLGYTLVEKPVTSTVEVQTSANSFVGKVDIIYVTTDNTVLTALTTLVETARDNKIPVMTCTQEDVQKGALLALGVSYEELSRLAANIAVEILEGKYPGNIPIAFAKSPNLFWNYGIAKELNISLPDSIISKVDVFYENGKEIENPYSKK